MAKVKIIDNGNILDTINADLVIKSGKKHYFIKKYKSESNIIRPFYPDKAVYSYVKGKGTYEILVDKDTLAQLSPKEAFIDKKIPPLVRTQNEEASDVMYAHKEAAKRIEANTVNLAQLVSWIAIIIVAIVLFLTVYTSLQGRTRSI